MTNITSSQLSDDPVSPVGTWCRMGVAVALFVSGLVHLQLYFDGYRSFPDANLGRSFLVNAVASTVVAIVLLFRRDVVVRLAAVAVMAATLIGFVLSRTDTGVFGFVERGLNPSPQAALALASEILAVVLVAATFVPRIGAGAPLPVLPAAVTGTAIVALSVAGAAAWARDDAAGTAAPATTVTTPTPTTPAPPATSAPASTGVEPGASSPQAPTTTVPPTTLAAATPSTARSGTQTVSIADFAFDAATLEVPVGTTVRWVNNDSFAHSVVANDATFQSAELAQGATFEFTFTIAGTFDYICGIHPSMLGQIIVTG